MSANNIPMDLTRIFSTLHRIAWENSCTTRVTTSAINPHVKGMNSLTPGIRNMLRASLNLLGSGIVLLATDANIPISEAITTSSIANMPINIILMPTSANNLQAFLGTASLSSSFSPLVVLIINKGP
ncbi:MAG: hypothetical protein A4E23_01608 [Methanomethylovorans sp. PtaU1.Bin073]|nr:MAG: hypothetical protein A4E23_01608 [Methanomethylovorans sp. PtaU1.Bin073]